jgi:hypothetical protein
VGLELAEAFGRAVEEMAEAETGGDFRMRR